MFSNPPSGLTMSVAWDVEARLLQLHTAVASSANPLLAETVGTVAFWFIGNALILINEVRPIQLHVMGDRLLACILFHYVTNH